MHWHRYKDISKWADCRMWVCEDCGDCTENYPYFDNALFGVLLAGFGLIGAMFLFCFWWDVI